MVTTAVSKGGCVILLEIDAHHGEEMGMLLLKRFADAIAPQLKVHKPVKIWQVKKNQVLYDLKGVKTFLEHQAFAILYGYLNDDLRQQLKAFDPLILKSEGVKEIANFRDCNMWYRYEKLISDQYLYYP